MTDKVSRELARFAAETRYEEVPKESINNSKLLLLDSIGCALAGITTEPGKMAIALAKRLGIMDDDDIKGFEPFL